MTDIDLHDADMLDEVDLALLDIFEMTAEAGVSATQTRAMLRERIEIAGDIAEDVLAEIDVPTPFPTIH